MNRRGAVTWGGERLIFATPNGLSQYRLETFATKEPGTIEWMDAVPEGAVVWDVGANVGLYTVYAARVRHCRVFAFEPSVFNLELLARNICYNNLQHRVTIVPIALGDAVAVSSFRMSTTEWGGAKSSFHYNVDQHGSPINEVFEYQTVGISIDDAASRLELEPPAYIKIDVDGIEHFILRGGRHVLGGVESVLIEINDDFTAQADESARHLSNAGLTLYRKCDLDDAPRAFNQWWRRTP